MTRLLTSILLCLAFLIPAQAQEQAPNSIATSEEFVTNNAIFTLYHEIGHMLIGELGIPILAKEEDAADNLAALLLLSAETAEADRALMDSADGWFLSEELNTAETFDDAEFYDTHSLDLQRAFQMVCLMVGADPSIFGELATNSGLDEERQESCAADFEQTSTSWNTVLEAFIIDPPDDSKITFLYEPTDDFVTEKELIESVRFFEHAVETILMHYALPRPVTLRASECGEANAFYDPEVGEVLFCYELASDFFYTYDQAYGAAAN